MYRQSVDGRVVEAGMEAEERALASRHEARERKEMTETRQRRV